MPLAFDEAFFEDFFVGVPEIGDVRGTEAENVFQRAADFPEMKIHADALEQFDERLGAHGFDRLGTGAVVVQPVVDRKSTRLNSSHSQISYAVFCLKKKEK